MPLWTRCQILLCRVPCALHTVVALASLTVCSLAVLMHVLCISPLVLSCAVAPQWRRLYDIALEDPADSEGGGGESGGDSEGGGGGGGTGPCLFEAQCVSILAHAAATAAVTTAVARNFPKNGRYIVRVCNLRSVDASEVVQGALGDCWLAAALSIVTQQPLLLHALFAAADIRAGGTVSCIHAL